MKIAYRIQHAKGRDAALARLLQHLIPVLPEVVTDHEVTDPNPFRNFQRCLSDPPDGATHLCVLQDDTVVCEGFGGRVESAVAQKPDDLLSLFVGGVIKETKVGFLRAMLARQEWYELRPHTKVVHVVATVWPVWLAREFLDWYQLVMHKIPSPLPHRSDDMVVSYWLKTNRPRRSVWATVPSLVEHPDDVPSVAQRNRKGDGQDRGRRAISFAG